MYLCTHGHKNGKNCESVSKCLRSYHLEEEDDELKQPQYQSVGMFAGNAQLKFTQTFKI